MGNKILITQLNRDERAFRICGVVNDMKLLEVHAAPLEQEKILGQIYVGKVQKIVKNLNAAFIEIAPGLACYYPLQELKNPLYVRKINSSSLVQGDELVVQVSKEALKTKQPSVSTNLTLTGRYCVLTLENTKVGVSSKFSKEQKKHYKELFAAEQAPQGPYGLIVRTNAVSVSEEELIAEISRLREQMDDLVQYAPSRSCFSCLYKPLEKYLEIIEKQPAGSIEEIITDDPAIYAAVQQHAQAFADLAQIPVRLYADKLQTLVKLYSIETQIDRALYKQVWLKSGGYLVIEPTEALTVIDVNTGKSVAKKDPQEHFLRLNIEAAREAAAQIRLRNLSGIILIDFIDLDAQEAKDALMEALKQAVKADPIPVNVVDMTRLQLVEITRKKVEKTLKEQLT